MEQVINPYAAPRAVIDGAPGDGEYQEPRLFAVSGRIGRIRYLSNVTGVYLIAMFALVLVGAISQGLRIHSLSLVYIAMGVVYIGVFVLWWMLAIQRCHDIDNSGWLSLMWLVPLLNVVFFLYLLFMPGDQEPNRFGKPTPPNSVVSVIIACVLPGLMLIGFLAALALLPANVRHGLR
jgi:uncharacterized membrane protein YhaH (DUF805 family)